jgi:hypothetical protein
MGWLIIRFIMKDAHETMSDDEFKRFVIFFAVGCAAITAILLIILMIIQS